MKNDFDIGKWSRVQRDLNEGVLNEAGLNKFVITINTGNDAFQADEGAEVIRILQDLIKDMHHRGVHNKILRDSNGNTVGSTKDG